MQEHEFDYSILIELTAVVVFIDTGALQLQSLYVAFDDEL